MNAAELSVAVKRRAGELGCSECRIATVGDALHAPFFERWIEQGRAGEMSYLARNVAKRRNPALLAEAGQEPYASLVVLGFDYHQYDLPPEIRNDRSRGLIASYAWGDDYHEIIRPLLYELDGSLRRLSGRQSQGKCLVDTGPVLERDWALAAGLGFTGKNCCTIVPSQGSWGLLAVVIVPEVLQPDPPIMALTAQRGSRRAATCGQCTRCLSACPTDAFAAPYDLDPQRCISYWTIEAAGAIPRELRQAFGNRIFGCDICQEVCPYNQRLAERTPRLAGLQAQADRVAPYLLDGFAPENPYWLDDGAFREHFRRSPIKRARRAGMLRNVCVALGNWAGAETLAALELALRDGEPVPRQHAAWAVGQVAERYGHSAIAEAAVDILRGAAVSEAAEPVRAEIAAALASIA